MQRAFALAKRLTQPMQVTLVILFVEKAPLPIVTALHDVQRDIIDVNARAAGHLGIVAQINASLTPLILCPPAAHHGLANRPGRTT